jgi:hypothetical protein
MKIPQSRSYIRSNPRFALTRESRPSLHEGQMTILYDALEQRPREHSLEDLISLCSIRGYESTFTNPNTDIRKSILYQLNRLLNGTAIVPPSSIRISSSK